jgi:aminoglycoside phosphotransferase (APT) family kinase protein
LSQPNFIFRDMSPVAIVDWDGTRPGIRVCNFAWLIVSIPADKVAFLGDAALDPPEELNAQAHEAARVFLAAHTPRH